MYSKIKSTILHPPSSRDIRTTQAQETDNNRQDAIQMFRCFFSKKGLTTDYCSLTPDYCYLCVRE